MFGKIKSAVRAHTLDEKVYEIVAAELAAGQLRPGLWAKALAESGYNENKAKARYMKLRGLQVAEELDARAAQQAAQEQLAREAVERQRANDEEQQRLAQQEVVRRYEAAMDKERALKKARKYLRNPIAAEDYLAQTGGSEEELSAQISKGVLEGYVLGGVLYVENGTANHGLEPTR